jgi:hypothetical protein
MKDLKKSNPRFNSHFQDLRIKSKEQGQRIRGLVKLSKAKAFSLIYTIKVVV